MLIVQEEILKDKCKDLIEAKLNWGSSESWTNRDFDTLSDKIYEVTGVTLSQTTLKRIWGKVKYDSAPAVTTLDTLARFLGFEHWRDFRHNQTVQPVVGDAEQQPAVNKSISKAKKYRKPYLILPVIVVLAIIGFESLNFPHSSVIAKKNKTSAVNYQFSSKKIVSLGVPNSVVFDYDASAAPVDSIFIQQSWDNNLRSQVPREQHLHTSIYYYPGFFQAKLIAGNQIVKEHDIFIQTDGWLTLAEQQPVPIYFKKGAAMEDGKLKLSLAKLKAQNPDMKSSVPFVYYANIREFGDLKSDDFILETSVKNDFPEGAGICQKSEIRLICEGSMVSIPLSAKGCISNNNLFCFGHFIKGSENDLSGFGVDFARFVKLRLQVMHGMAKFFVDDKLVYQIENVVLSSKIKGIVFRFQGTGSVDWVKLFRGDSTLVYDDEF